MAKVRCKVVGPFEVAGVKRPGTVELDDEKVNVRALVKAGHVELVKQKASDQGGNES